MLFTKEIYKMLFHYKYQLYHEGPIILFTAEKFIQV